MKLYLPLSTFIIIISGCDTKEEKVSKVKIRSDPDDPKPVVERVEGRQELRRPSLPKAGPLQQKSYADSEKTASQFCGGGDLSDGMRFFESAPMFDNYQDYLEKFARRLARESPDAGLTWLLGLEWSEVTGAAWAAFGGEVALKSDEDPGSYAERLTSAKVKTAFYCGVVQTIAESSLADAADLIRQNFSDSNSQRTLARSAINHLYADPESVLKMIGQFPGVADETAYGRALYNMWKKDPEKGQQYWDQVDDKNRTSGLYGFFVSEYVNDDYIGASEWVASLPVGRARDEAASTLAMKISGRFPLDALKWGINVGGEIARDGSVGTLLRNAVTADAAAALQIINNSGLDAKEIQKWTGLINHYSSAK